MSKKGKAIAIARVRAAARESVAKAACIDSPFKSLLMYGTEYTAQLNVAAVARIPHEHFNSAGKIDKRKVRRHDRKSHRLARR